MMLLISGILYIVFGAIMIGVTIHGLVTYGFNEPGAIFGIFMGAYGLFWIVLGTVGIFKRNSFDKMLPLIIAAAVDAALIIPLNIFAGNFIFILYLPLPALYALGAYRNKLQ